MPKVTVVQVIYNSKKYIQPVFEAIFRQTFKDFNVVAVIAGNADGGKEFLSEKFPQVEIIDPGYNIGFAKGHNLVFEKYPSDFFQLVNPDLIMEPNYIEEILKAFEDPKVGAATGKLLRYDFENNQPTKTIDSTGVSISKSGRARDRGQHEIDYHQFDDLTSVDAVSGAGAMYRREALKAIKTPILSSRPSPSESEGERRDLLKDSSTRPDKSGLARNDREFEFFDEDFHSYWEDVDLSWRMANAGWKNVYVPSAVGYHGRASGSSKGGYKDIGGFIRHHRKLSSFVRQLNYKNHIFMYIKNSKWFYPQFFVREFFMLIYILVFETGTLKVLPGIFELLPKMWQKRKNIQNKIHFERSEKSVL